MTVGGPPWLERCGSWRGKSLACRGRSESRSSSADAMSDKQAQPTPPHSHRPTKRLKQTRLTFIRGGGGGGGRGAASSARSSSSPTPSSSSSAPHGPGEAASSGGSTGAVTHEPAGPAEVADAAANGEPGEIEATAGSRLGFESVDMHTFLCHAGEHRPTCRGDRWDANHVRLPCSGESKYVISGGGECGRHVCKEAHAC